MFLITFCKISRKNWAKTTGEVIGKISSVIGGVNEIVATIATAVEEQSAATKEIAGNLIESNCQQI